VLLNRTSSTVALAAALLASACGLADEDWPVYLGDPGRRHYSPLTEINRDNVSQLEVAWVHDSGEPRGAGATMYTSPLVVDGVLYALSPQLDAFALDAATGEEIWRTDLGLPGNAQRGLMWWERGSERRLFYSHGKDLIALDADDGSLVSDFGEGGILDLTPEVERNGVIFVTVPGVVFEDKLILGFSTNEDSNAYPGSIRAFSAVDGSLVWQFDTIPAPGEPGSETWAEGSLERAGGANVWTGMALDEESGILFAPTGSATPDFYGASRLGDNLYSDSLVAVDAGCRTGLVRRRHGHGIAVRAQGDHVSAVVRKAGIGGFHVGLLAPTSGVADVDIDGTGAVDRVIVLVAPDARRPAAFVGSADGERTTVRA